MGARKNGTFSTIADWSSTIGKLRGAQARVRAICPRCPFDQFVCLKGAQDKLGASYSFWNQTVACRQPGCDGRVWFQASLPGPGFPTNMQNGTPHEANRLRAAWREDVAARDPAAVYRRVLPLP